MLRTNCQILIGQRLANGKEPMPPDDHNGILRDSAIIWGPRVMKWRTLVWISPSLSSWGQHFAYQKKKNQNEQVTTSEGHWILIVDWYCMCKGNKETVDYLLCHTATSVWSFVFMLLGLTWMPKYVCENDDFRAVKPLLWGEPCPHVLCGLCGTKEIGRSLMELSDLLIWSKRKFVSFVDFIDTLSLWVVFFEKVLCQFSFPFLLEFFTHQKRKLR